MNGGGHGDRNADVRALAEELREIKELLKEMSREMLRIERRVEATFPRAAATPGNTRKKKGVALDEGAARRLLAQLSERTGRGEDVGAVLNAYTVKPDLQTIASVLGMTNAKLPPKAELIKRITTRLRQSSSVRAGIVGQPDS